MPEPRAQSGRTHTRPNQAPLRATSSIGAAQGTASGSPLPRFLAAEAFLTPWDTSGSAAQVSPRAGVLVAQVCPLRRCPRSSGVPTAQVSPLHRCPCLSWPWVLFLLLDLHLFYPLSKQRRLRRQTWPWLHERTPNLRALGNERHREGPGGTCPPCERVHAHSCVYTHGADVSPKLSLSLSSANCGP